MKAVSLESKTQRLERWTRPLLVVIALVWFGVLSSSPAGGQQAGLQPMQQTTEQKTIDPEGETTRTAISSPAEVPSGEVGRLEMSVEPYLRNGPEFMTDPDGMVSTLQIMLILTVLTLSPSIVIMTTSFVRIIVVLGLLRQAIGTAQLPPTQVITSLALFLTLLIMTPVWSQVYEESILPYTQREIGLEEAWEKGEFPIRRFMSMQIHRTGNTDDILLFMKYIPDAPTPTGYEDVPWRALLPAYMLSELKTAFLIGFQIYLPFLILDIVIAAVMVSMGMMMLPPVVVSLPFKIMLFVLLDGWRLVVGMLLESFAWYV